MTRLRITLITLALGATGLASPLAAAKSSSFAEMMGFSWQLIDLTPNDALGVSISFGAGSNAVQASNSAVGDFQNGAGPLTAAANGGTGLGWATGLVSPLGAGIFSLTATANSTGNYVFATGDASRLMDFTLSAGTQVVFTAQASVLGAITQPEFGEDATCFV